MLNIFKCFLPDATQINPQHSKVNGKAHADDGDKDDDGVSRSKLQSKAKAAAKKKPQPKAKAAAKKTGCLKKGP